MFNKQYIQIALANTSELSDSEIEKITRQRLNTLTQTDFSGCTCVRTIKRILRFRSARTKREVRRQRIENILKQQYPKVVVKLGMNIQGQECFNITFGAQIDGL